MKKEWVVSKKDHQLRIDDFAYLHHISKKCLKDMKMKGDILVDGVHQTVRYHLQVGEIVTFIFPDEMNQIPPEYIPFDIVYEDHDLMVIDKPAGIPCIPTRAHPSHTLANGISYYYQSIGLKSTVHFVNRLDKDTSGLMVVAKYRYIHDLMSQNMGHMYRLYHAYVQGHVQQGEISLPIYREGQDMKRVIDERGKKSLTHYRCLKTDQGSSYVECRLETGRTHQIRVHMAAIGHPLIGDPLYGDGNGSFYLDSFKICFKHPITHRYISIEKKERQFL